MSGQREKRDWRDALIASYPGLFKVTESGLIGTPGYPTVGDGWRELVETAVARIAKAVDAAQPGSAKIVQIKEKFGGLCLYWQGWQLGAATDDAIDEAVALAEARAACTCETCGEEGRLHNKHGWLLTACDLHAQGDPVTVQPGFENVRLVWTVEAGKILVVSRRRYIRATDSFVDLDPKSIDIEE